MDGLPRLEDGIDDLNSSLKELHIALQRDRLVEGLSRDYQKTSFQDLHDRISSFQRIQEKCQVTEDWAIVKETSSQEQITDQHTGPSRVDIKITAVDATRVAQTAATLTRRPLHSLRKSVSLPLGLAAATAMAIAIPLAVVRCSTSCGCVCHRRHTKRSPIFLDQFLGTLFCGYHGLPYLVPACDSPRCTGSDATAKITYHFPPWLLAHSFALSAAWSPTSGFGVNVQFPRLINPYSRIFLLSEQGDVEGMHEAFRQGLASPLDASASDGETALMV